MIWILGTIVWVLGILIYLLIGYALIPKGLVDEVLEDIYEEEENPEFRIAMESLLGETVVRILFYGILIVFWPWVHITALYRWYKYGKEYMYR